MTFDYSAGNVYHFAIVVPEIERGIEQIAKQFNVSFPPHLPVSVKGLSGGKEINVETRFVYSRQGPPFIEVLQAIPGTVFDAPAGGSRVHHFGIFVEDMEAEVARLTNEGFQLEFQTIESDGRPSRMSLVNSELGVRQELVSAELRSSIEPLTNR